MGQKGRKTVSKLYNEAAIYEVAIEGFYQAMNGRTEEQWRDYLSENLLPRLGLNQKSPRVQVTVPPGTKIRRRIGR